MFAKMSIFPLEKSLELKASNKNRISNIKMEYGGFKI